MYIIKQYGKTQNAMCKTILKRCIKQVQKEWKYIAWYHSQRYESEIIVENNKKCSEIPFKDNIDTYR